MSDQGLGVGVPFEGVTVVKEFVSHEEEVSIMAAIDGQPWANSQSGRRKQVRLRNTLRRVHQHHLNNGLPSITAGTYTWAGIYIPV